MLQGPENSITEGRHVKVYIGGEVVDLLCLVEADIGIVFRPSTTLIKLGKRYGISFFPLYQGVVRNQIGDDWESRRGKLYTVKSWAEIQAFILGL